MFTKQWFKQNQSLLLWMVNTSYGRDLLCIDKHYPKIIQVLPHAIKGELEPGKFLYNFKTYEKYAKLIQLRWKEFCFYAQYYQSKVTPLISYSRPYSEIALVATTYGPYNPASGAGGTTCDGHVERQGVDETFTDLRSGAGTSHGDTGGGFSLAHLYGHITTANHFSAMKRAISTYDTSPIGGAETVTDALLQFYADSSFNSLGLSAAHAAIATCGVTPGNNGDLADSDYNIANWGSTRYVTTDFAFYIIGSGAWLDFNFNAAGCAAVNKTGVTAIGNRSAVDMDNGTPNYIANTNYRFDVYTAEVDGTHDPALTVTAEVPSGGIPRMMGGIGS